MAVLIYTDNDYQIIPPSVPYKCGWDMSTAARMAKMRTRLFVPKLRGRRYVGRLVSFTSNRHFNTGRHGAGDEGAPTWDEYGEFFAAIFQRDPQAIIVAGGRRYRGAIDFHAQTAGRYFKGWDAE